MKVELWRHKTKPNILVVEAIRLNEENVRDVAAWCGADTVEEIDPEHPQEVRIGLNVDTPAGVDRASLGMYVARLGRHIFVVHNRVFETHYEPVNKPAPPLESAGDARKARGFGDPFDSGRFG